MKHIRILLIFTTFLFAINLQSQESSKNYGSKEFEDFFSEISNYLRNYELVKAQSVLDDFKTRNLSQLDCNQKALLYQRQGAIYFSKEDDTNALKYWLDSTLFYWQKCDIKSEYHYALTQANIGNSYRFLSQYAKASMYLNKAAQLWEQIEDLDKGWHARKLLDNASFFTNIGDGYNANLIFDRVENLLPELKDKELQANYYKMKGFDLYSSNQFEDAIASCKNAIVFYKSDEKKFFRDLVVCYFNSALSNLDLGNYTQCSNQLDSMKLLFDKYEYTKMFSRYQNAKAITYKHLGDYVAAKKTVLSQIQDLENSATVDIKRLSFGYENLADILVKEGKYEEAFARYNKARDLYLPPNSSYESLINNSNQSILNPINFATCLNQIAITKNLQYQQTGDSKFLEEAADIYEEIKIVFDRDRLSTYNEVKKSIASDKIKQLYQEAVKTYVSLYKQTHQNEYLELAYQYASTNKSLLQKEKAINNKVFRELLPDSLSQQEALFVRNINRTYSRIQNNTDFLQKDSLYSALSLVQSEYEAFVKNIGERYPKYYADIYAEVSPLTIQQVQNNLQAGDLLLDYYFGSDSLYCFAITQQECQLTSTLADNVLLSDINQARDNLEDGNETRKELLQKLYRVLVKPHTHGKEQRLKIIGDDQLLKLPFEALLNGQEYLIQRYPISYLLSNNDLENATKKIDYTMDYVGFGSTYSDQLNSSLVNVISKDFLPLSQLSKAPQEIESSNLIWGGSTFINQSANKENFIAKANSSSILHIAMHGIINTKFPEQSALIFDDRKEECILKVNEIYQMNLENELVILSSCDSGSGKIYSAEGTQSLARGFAVAGAPAIVSSLWAAYDDPTSKIMASFNENLANGEDKDVALQKAKLTYLETAFPTLKAPKYWSNIVLIGDTSPMSIAEASPMWMYLAIGLVLLFGIFLGVRKIKSN
ncbi:MAG: CHAT domain-containing protein [Saprospiraceae bacterium]|nr:CHAT domain-containing protein [Saprospiraceae bacterium]